MINASAIPLQRRFVVDMFSDLQVKNMKSPPEGVITVSKALCWMCLGCRCASHAEIS